MLTVDGRRSQGGAEPLSTQRQREDGGFHKGNEDDPSVDRNLRIRASGMIVGKKPELNDLILKCVPVSPADSPARNVASTTSSHSLFSVYLRSTGVRDELAIPGRQAFFWGSSWAMRASGRPPSISLTYRPCSTAQVGVWREQFWPGGAPLHQRSESVPLSPQKHSSPRWVSCRQQKTLKTRFADS